MNNLEKFIINPTNEFHILRHFKYVTESYKKTLVGKPYWYYDHNKKKFISSKISNNDIENALATIGTKFEENVSGIESPKKLLEIIETEFRELLKNNKMYWTNTTECEAASFTFNYSFDVGQKNCIDKNTLVEKDRVRIKSILRSKCSGESSVTVNTISNLKLSSTKSIYVEITEIKQLPFYIITSFPDCSLSDNVPDEDIVFVV
jgi:hypothetical protein